MFYLSKVKTLFIVSTLLLLSACTPVNYPSNNNDTSREIEGMEETLHQLRAEIVEKELQLASLEKELQSKENELAKLTEEIEEKKKELEDMDSVSEVIRDKADSVVIGLEHADFHTLAIHAHPEKGIRFSPYGYVDIDEHLQFTSDEIKEFSEDKTQYIWGTQDGSGHPIELTPNEYYEQYIFIRDFSKNAQEINFNEINDRGNIIVNVEEVYPDANFMEYYVSAEEDSLNWASLILAFEKYNGEWYLVGVIVDRWTI